MHAAPAADEDEAEAARMFHVAANTATQRLMIWLEGVGQIAVTLDWPTA
jgi:hypothetical protein